MPKKSRRKIRKNTKKFSKIKKRISKVNRKPRYRKTRRKRGGAASEETSDYNERVRQQNELADRRHRYAADYRRQGHDRVTAERLAKEQHMRDKTNEIRKAQQARNIKKNKIRSGIKHGLANTNLSGDAINNIVSFVPIRKSDLGPLSGGKRRKTMKSRRFWRGGAALPPPKEPTEPHPDDNEKKQEENKPGIPSTFIPKPKADQEHMLKMGTPFYDPEAHQKLIQSQPQPKSGPKKRNIPEEDPDEGDYEHWADSAPERYTGRKGLEYLLEDNQYAARNLMEEMFWNKGVDLDNAYGYAVNEALYGGMLNDHDTEDIIQTLNRFHYLAGVVEELPRPW